VQFDIHFVEFATAICINKNDWGGSIYQWFHEIVGKVVQVGSHVKV
jgi:D-arabinose 1-dehydrogenase-like Zn-dependent alcohol dehydrogenase